MEPLAKLIAQCLQRCEVRSRHGVALALISTPATEPLDCSSTASTSAAMAVRKWYSDVCGSVHDSCLRIRPRQRSHHSSQQRTIFVEPSDIRADQMACQAGVDQMQLGCFDQAFPQVWRPGRQAMNQKTVSLPEPDSGSMSCAAGRRLCLRWRGQAGRPGGQQLEEDRQRV